MINDIQKTAQKWLNGKYDDKTKAEIRHMLENNKDELIEAFYKNLEFGTGGLRGIMGAGTNRMNVYTVGMATQGLCNYLKKVFADLPQIKVAIAYDCRNNSKLFAETSANIFSANNIKVYIFDDLRPTPELSFAIRHFSCQSGIVITASHNPKEYNGYKVYWEDGAQVIAPHDKNIIKEVEKITEIEQIKFTGNTKLIETIGAEIDEIYTEKIKGLSLSPEIIKRQSDLKIVYTPIHGTGVRLVPMTLKKMGFNNICNIPEQDITSGDFPTVYSPNPEEKSAMNMALEKAGTIDADIVMATDPDADRVGIGVKNSANEFILLNGNQTATIIINYLISKWKEQGRLTGKEYIVKTIVTSEILSDIANKYNVECFDVLTGFKYIADIIRQNEGSKRFIGGGEESYGYLAGEFVRDKDAVMSCAIIAEIAAVAKENNKTLYDVLIDIYKEFGIYREELLSITKKGKSGLEEIATMMNNFRNNPPVVINNSKVVKVLDYNTQLSNNIASNTITKINLPKSNVLQFILSDESKISIRPSGTEPKIKFYFSVKGLLNKQQNFEDVYSELGQKIENIKKSLQL